MSLTASAGKLFHNPMVLKKKVVLFTRVQHKIISNIVSSYLSSYLILSRLLFCCRFLFAMSCTVLP